MKILEWKKLDRNTQQNLLKRSEVNIREAITAVTPIIEGLRTRGDSALREYVRDFDGANIDTLPIQLSMDEFYEAESLLDPEVKLALEYAIENVKRFHSSQTRQKMSPVSIRRGIRVTERHTPIDSLGLYVPRGRGSFPSMLYMLAVPAVLAGVPHIAIASPPLPDGRVDAACLYAAKVCGVERVYRMGGSQAIAAFAFGTESVDRVNKVVGPGSAYVNAAKRLLSDWIDPGLPAGPSESIIVADEQADPHLLALDLFIEAEHGSDSSAILITTSRSLAEEVRDRAEKYLEEVPEPRQGFIRDVFKKYGCILLSDTIEEAFDLVNDFAPEHLQIQTTHPQSDLSLVRNAGEILLGKFAPFTLANYAVGANAVLPTGGKARTWSAVSVRDFMKSSSIVEVDSEAYTELAEHCRVLAKYEGFYTHHKALVRRSTKPSNE